MHGATIKTFLSYLPFLSRYSLSEVLKSSKCSDILLYHLNNAGFSNMETLSSVQNYTCYQVI